MDGSFDRQMRLSVLDSHHTGNGSLESVVGQLSVVSTDCCGSSVIGVILLPRLFEAPHEFMSSKLPNAADTPPDIIPTFLFVVYLSTSEATT